MLNPHSQPGGTVQPLTIGRVVNAGVQLYRQHLKQYLRVALTATLWLLLPFVAGAIVVLFFAIVQDYYATLGLLIPALIVLLVYCLMKYLVGAATLSRLAFQALIAQPETPQDASRFVNRRKWRFFWAAMLVGLILGAVFVGFYMLLGIVFAIAIGASGGFATPTPSSDPSIWVVTWALSALLVIGFGVLATWLAARLSIPEVALAVESDTARARQSIGRSWILTGNNAWRIALILLISLLVTLPFQVLTQLVSITLQGLQYFVPFEYAFIAPIVIFIVTYALGSVVGIALLPLWQSVKAVLYYDLRSRREGLGLQLGNADAGDVATRWLSHVTLLTPESVELEFTLAGVGSRALALLIDYNILAIGGTLLSILYAVFVEQLLNYLDTLNADYSDLTVWLAAIALLLAFVVFAGYFVCFEVLWQGQTPGKRLTHIRVIRDDGKPVGIAQAALRALLRSLDDFLFLGMFLIIFGRREKRLGDLVAGTLVVEEARSTMKTPLKTSDAANKLAPTLLQTTKIGQLRPEDFAAVREYLQRRDAMQLAARRDLSLELARQTRSLIELETIPTGLTSDQFLEAVYVAYQKQSRA